MMVTMLTPEERKLGWVGLTFNRNNGLLVIIWAKRLGNAWLK
jgi:hypothetical protein